MSPSGMHRQDSSIDRRRENERKLMEEIADVEILEDTMNKSIQTSTQMVTRIHLSPLASTRVSI
jgi:hypothetical protein